MTQDKFPDLTKEGLVIRPLEPMADTREYLTPEEWEKRKNRKPDTSLCDLMDKLGVPRRMQIPIEFTGPDGLKKQGFWNVSKETYAKLMELTNAN